MRVDVKQVGRVDVDDDDVTLQDVCKFVPTNGDDDRHRDELLALLEAWADPTTAIYTEDVLTVRSVMGSPFAASRGVWTLLAHGTGAWHQRHHALVLARDDLRTRRRASSDTLRGRGVLTIPLFVWLRQQLDPLATPAKGTPVDPHVHRFHGMLRRCKWFLKADTDTFLRPRVLVASVLSGVSPTDSLIVGRALDFSTLGFNVSRSLTFQYAIGGPGYGLSVGVLTRTAWGACLRAMATEPVLLVHDDVAVGYCATQHAGQDEAGSGSGNQVEFITVDASVASTSTDLVTDIVVATSAGTAGMRACIQCAVSIHPVSAGTMVMLADADKKGGAGHHRCFGECGLMLVAGVPAIVGRVWAASLPQTLADIATYWNVEDDDDERDVAHSRRALPPPGISAHRYRGALERVRLYQRSQ
jgi:hypothetical protein